MPSCSMSWSRCRARCGTCIRWYARGVSDILHVKHEHCLPLLAQSKDSVPSRRPLMQCPPAHTGLIAVFVVLDVSTRPRRPHVLPVYVPEHGIGVIDGAHVRHPRPRGRNRDALVGGEDDVSERPRVTGAAVPQQAAAQRVLLLVTPRRRRRSRRGA